MASCPPLNTLDPDDLVIRKDQLVEQLTRQLRQLGLAPDYPWNVMVAARDAGLADADHIAVLQTLLEIESIKYTLAAHMVRQLQAESP